MIPTAQFDQATLAVWTTTGAFFDSEAQIADAAIRVAMRGESPVDLLTAIPENDPHRLRLLWLVSAVWHEKRHFFDTFLTTYGARRFRNLFNLAANFAPVGAHAEDRGEPIWFPVEVYDSPVHRKILGIADPPPNVQISARSAKRTKRLDGELDAFQENGGRVVYLGGEAQLEGLAQVSQLNCIEQAFGRGAVAAVSEAMVHPMDLGGPYRSIEVLAGMLGCTREKKGQVELNPNLAAALFATALCGRFLGTGSTPPEDLVSPWPRLARMLEALGPSPGRFDMSEQAAADLVDGVARRLWGRTALDEIAADTDEMEKQITLEKAPWLDRGGLWGAFRDYISLRRDMLGAARNVGPAALLPGTFAVGWRDRLLPFHVVATPVGDGEDASGEVVFGARFAPRPGFPSLVTWGRLQDTPARESKKTFGLSDHEAWKQMLTFHGPIAMLMLNGRNNRRMVPPEIESALATLRQEGIKVAFHPRFEWPATRSTAERSKEALALAAFTSRSHFVCDITGDTIEAADAAVITAWEFRRSKLIDRFREEAGLIAQFRLATDWSDWIVRRDLLSD
jgi:hypothetical protein